LLDNLDAPLPIRGGEGRQAIKDNLEQRTYSVILDALDRFGGNKTKAAEYLGVSRTYLWRKLRLNQQDSQQERPL
jgi:DNA-binding NtrC family response regulator